MAVEFFLVPIVSLPPGGLAQFEVKYQHNEAVSTYDSKRYSWDSHALLMLDATQDYLDFVAAQSDVYRICAEGDLTENIGGPANVALSNWMASWNMPDNWISGADSYRQVLRGIIGMFQFAQIHEFLNQEGFFTHLFRLGFDMNTQWQNLNQEFRDSIQEQIDRHGWPDQPANNDQVKKILKDFSDKFEGTQMIMSGIFI